MNRRLDTGTRSRRPPLKPFLISLVAAPILFLAAHFVPLPELEKLDIVTSYGSYDNRRLFLEYGALLLGALLGPLLAGWLDRRRDPAEVRVDAPAGPPVPARKLSSRLLIGAGAAILGGLLLIGPGVAYRSLNGHELVHLGYLNDIEHGKVLNVNTRVTYGPLLGYSIWAFMKLVRFDLVGFRLYWNVINAVFLGLMFLVAAGWFRKPGFFFAFVLYGLLGTSAVYFLPDSAGINGGLWGLGTVARHGWTALGILALGRALMASRSWLPRVLVGVFAAVSGVYSPETLFPSLGAFACLLWSARPAPWRTGVREAAAVIAGMALVIGPMLFPVIVRNGLTEYVRASRHVSSLFLRGFGNTRFPDLFSGGLAASSIIYYVFPAAVLGLLVFHWNRRLRNVSLSRIEFPLAVYSSLSMINLLVRADTAHLLNVTLTPLLLIFLTLDDWMSSTPQRIPASLQRLVAPACLVPLFFIHPGLPDLGRGLAGRFAHWNPPPPAGFERIPGARGGIWTPAESWFDADWGPKDDPAGMTMIRKLTRGRATFFSGPRASLYYFLSDVPCAIQYTDLSSQRFTRDDFIEVKRAVLKAGPEYIFAYRMKEDETPFVQLNYRLFGLKRGFWIYQRNDLPPLKPQDVRDL